MSGDVSSPGAWSLQSLGARWPTELFPRAGRAYASVRQSTTQTPRTVRVNGYSQQRGSKCVVAFDSQDEGNDQIVARRMKNFLFRSDEGRSMQGLLETAFFVSSKVEEGIQLADLVAGIIRHHHEHPADRAFRNWVDTLYTQIRSRTMMVPAPNGTGDLYGIYFMPERYFYAQDSAS